MSATPGDETLPSLARLPPELVHRIASLGTCSSALNLRLVCRAFHLICDSRILFKKIIHNGNGLSVPYPSSSRWVYSELVLSSQAPVYVWMRYAFADMKARELSVFPKGGFSSTGLEVDLRPEQVLPRRAESWLPQLCALHHPELEIDTIVASAITALMAPVGAMSFSAEETALSFVLACRLLTEYIVSRSYTDTSWMRLRNVIFMSYERNPNRGRILARLVVGFMAVDINFRIYQNVPPWQNAGVGFAQRVVSILPPPSLKQIPFADLMTRIPLPFEPASEQFNVCHLERMASKAFLEAGEWVGFYCSPIQTARLHFDPPMRGIFFEVVGESDERLMLLRADGSDAFGRFNLRGTLHTGTGDVNMIKQYLGAHRWSWSGSLTPFGLVGTWGGRNAWFWLWKADWCR